MKRIFVGITGASGSIYGLKLLKFLSRLNDVETHLSITKEGLQNIRLELSEDILSGADFLAHAEISNVFYHECDNMASSVASGSSRTDHTVIIPASMGFVGRCAGGISSNLIERCSDVALKENRQLVIVFREMPLSVIHLNNLLTLSKAGALVLPASPGFYHSPGTLDEVLDFVVGKVLDAMGLDNSLFKRWE